jgi:hypothetical protein
MSTKDVKQAARNLLKSQATKASKAKQAKAVVSLYTAKAVAKFLPSAIAVIRHQYETVSHDKHGNKLIRVDDMTSDEIQALNWFLDHMDMTKVWDIDSYIYELIPVRKHARHARGIEALALRGLLEKVHLGYILTDAGMALLDITEDHLMDSYEEAYQELMML